MTAKRTFAVTILAFFCVLPSGCRKKKKGTKLTKGSKYDATKPIVDKDYRFRLNWPGKGWKLGREDEIQKVFPGALAAAVDIDRMIGLVFVERNPEDSAEKWARSFMEEYEYENKKLVSLKKLRFQGNDAVRVEFTGKGPFGTTAAICATVFRYQQYMYVLTARREKHAPEGCEWAEVFFKSFKFLGGKIKDRRLKGKVTVADSSGVGWRVKSGIYENAIFGFTLRPTGDWRLIPGDDLLGIDTSAEAGLRSTDGRRTLLVIAATVPDSETNTYAPGAKRTFIKNYGLKCSTSTTPVAVGVSQVVFRLCTEDKLPKKQYWHAVHCPGERCFLFVFSSESKSAKSPQSLIASALEGFRALTKDRTQKLRRELGPPRFPPVQMGALYSLRRGVYRDFKRSLKWTMPPGFWRVRLGEEAGGKDSNDFLAAEEPRMGIEVIISSEPSKDKTPAAYHREAVEAYAANFTKVKKGLTESITIKGGKILVTRFRGIDKIDGMKTEEYVATAVRGKTAFDFRATGFTQLSEKATPMIKKAFKGLALETSPAVTARGIDYIDRRFGFAIRLPAWLMPLTPKQYNGPTSTKIEWKRGFTKIVIMARALHGLGRDPEKLIEMLEQTLRDGVTGKIHKAFVTVGGVKATHLYNKQKIRTDAFCLARDQVFYMFIIETHEAHDHLAKQVEERFRFLP